MDVTELVRELSAFAMRAFRAITVRGLRAKRSTRYRPSSCVRSAAMVVTMQTDERCYRVTGSSSSFVT